MYSVNNLFNNDDIKVLDAKGAFSVEVKGRHDPCIVPRAVPVVEAAAAIAIYDLILGNTQTSRRK